MSDITHQDHHHAILFYDGSCGLCRKEISLLQHRLHGKIQLQDISDTDFSSYQGITAEDMMANLHVWDGSQFIIGLDASLYYWSLAGMHKLVWFIRLPIMYQLGKLGYIVWARFRPKQTHCLID